MQELGQAAKAVKDHVPKNPFVSLIRVLVAQAESDDDSRLVRVNLGVNSEVKDVVLDNMDHLETVHLEDLVLARKEMSMVKEVHSGILLLIWPLGNYTH